MKNKKKSIIIIILIMLIMLIMLILATGVYIIYNVVGYMTYITKNPAIENQTLYSYDEAYVMNVLVELVENTPDSQMHYVNIIILDSDTGEEVYAIRNVYRAYDFHWVNWEKDSYNFSLYSGDLGTFCYEYQGDDTWERHVIEKESENDTE